ncbi:uncharacterized protein SCHCODRAFT_02627636 [Schizophyllum commune H4-8]|uniref:uncharacterized protein n=1 Tax=Schizophyllum commune (strain H4-8 / FGSC 9210) TaxID=578458 RepID=UPI0021603774|nr:uncharacterized protein SCHCODRAFT_02627636 [Schizophyllum commune H4-8]KAI5890919.1 hypothetical protein SCHCODRAFT_02627636 [Schizophyllum commune H4-8]
MTSRLARGQYKHHGEPAPPMRMPKGKATNMGPSITSATKAARRCCQAYFSL